MTSHICTHIAFPRLRVSTYKMDPQRANLLCPSPASRGAPFVTTPPATPARLSNSQYVSSTPDSNHTANSVTGTLEDVLPRLKAELQGRHVVDLPLNAFLKRFVTLEDAQCELYLLHLYSKSKSPSQRCPSHLLHLDSYCVQMLTASSPFLRC